MTVVSPIGPEPAPLTEGQRLWDLARRKGLLSSEAYASGLSRLRAATAEGREVVSALVEAGLSREQVEELQAVHADGGPIGLPVDLPPESEAVRVGKYRLLESLGVGAMGAVYRAVDEELGRAVALKVLKGGTEFTCDDSADRFQQEAHSLAHLDHPNIVRVYEAGRADGQAYLALELVAGGSLSSRDYAALPVARKTAIGRDIARALQHAHERRYATAGALADDLERVLAGDSPSVRTISVTHRIWRLARRRGGALGRCASPYCWA